jgi:hypothetical protein
MTTLLLFSHSLTPDQHAELATMAPGATLLPLPDSLQLRFSQLPPGPQFDSESAFAIANWLEDNSQQGDFVFVQGEHGLTHYLVEVCRELGAVPIYATTKRCAIEQRLADGSIRIEHRFEHAGFREYPDPLGAGHRYRRALAFAHKLHAAQVRKGGDIPYFSHLIEVSAIVMTYGGDENAQIAALLHDAVEDQGGEPTRKRIERRFGARVAGIVSECSDTDVEPKPPWRARKEDYLEHLPFATSGAALVSLCDKFANLAAMLRDYREVGDGLWKRFKAGPADQLWFFSNVLTRMETRNDIPKMLLSEYRRLVDEMGTIVKAV